MRIRKSVLLITSLFFVCGEAGCGSIANINKNYALNKDSGKGVVIVSTTETGRHQSAKPLLCFRQVGQKYGKQLKMWGRQFIDSNGTIAPLLFDWLAPQIPQGKAVGNLHVIELAAGSYEVYSYSATWYGPNVTVTYSPKKEFSWRFDVEAGVARYIGNINFHILDLDFPQHMESLNDERERDLKLVEQRYPNLHLADIKIAIIEKSSADNIPYK